MQKPPFPPNEQERLEALHKLDILDTPREHRFDRLARLAARLLDVPITAISLVDTDRQWFKASEGLGDVRETPRDVSFCGHTILQDEPLVVADALEDARFADNPLVADDPSIRFYAGQPLRIGGLRVGAFCAIDRKPRQLTDEQLALLGDLRDLVERELQLDDINILRQRLEHAIRDKQQVEHELERFFSLPIDLLCVMRPEGTFKRLSSAWPDALGWSEAQLLSQPCVEFVHPEDQDATAAEIRRLSQGGRTVAFENRYRHRDGSYRCLLWNAIGSAHDDLIFATARDITAIKRMQALKDEFVSVVSHELRTPLTSIRGAVDLLAAGVAGELPAEVTSLIDVARNNCQRLSLLINDILDMEKVEAGKLQFNVENHPIVALVERAIEDNQQFAAGRSVSYRLVERSEELELPVDPDRLQQVLANLLSNAAKYEPEGGTVEISVVREAGSVRISVSDHGPGIPGDFHDRVFEKFAQADGSDRRRSGGSGLGLSIAKAIVERLGGKIGFDTEIDKGTTFYFELPCAIEQVPVASDVSLPRVLICEDDPDIAYILQLNLKQAGFASDVAGSLEQARTLLDRRSYIATTVDLMLPDGNGFSLIRELRDEAATRELPVVVVSALANEARTEFEGGAINVIDWLPKPVDPQRLLDSVKRATRTRTDKPRILHVEDDAGITVVTSRLLADLAEVATATTIAQAKSQLSAAEFNLVILDWKLPDGTASDLLPEIIKRDIPVVVFSAHDVPSPEARAVADVLVKSKVSNDDLRARIVEALAGAADALTV